MPEPTKLLERLFERIQGYREEMVSFQKELTAIPALAPENGGKGEMVRARFLKAKLEAYGFKLITEYNAEDQRVTEKVRPNLVVRVQGSTASPKVWIMAHMDTVPPGDLKDWQSDPFQAIVKEGKIFGRGVEDNQQGLVSGLFAMRALVDEGIQPATDVALLLVADEETGNTYGIEHVFRTAPNLVESGDIVIVPDAGSPDGAMIEVAEKSILFCEFTIQGKQVHASTPHQGINAHRAAAHLAVRLDQRLHSKFIKQDPMFDPPNSTFEPTKREANVPNVNTIPGRDRFYLDCRILPDYNVDDVIAVVRAAILEVEQEFGVSISLAFPNVSRAAPATPTDSPVVQLLTNAVREVHKIEPRAMGIGGGTVAAMFRRNGVPAAVWSTMDDMAHQANEYCVVDNLVNDAKVFAHVFVRGGC